MEAMMQAITQAATEAVRAVVKAIRDHRSSRRKCWEKSNRQWTQSQLNTIEAAYI